MPLTPIKKQELSDLLINFLDSVSQHASKNHNDLHEELTLILAKSQSICEDDTTAYANFLHSLSEQLIQLLESEFDKNVINAADIFKKLNTLNIDKLFPESYNNSITIQNIKKFLEATISNYPMLHFENQSSSSNATNNHIAQPSRHTPTIFSSNLNRSIDETLSAQEILNHIEQELLGANKQKLSFYPKQVINLLKKIENNCPEKFKEILELKSEWEGNTLLLTALSLEHLELAEYLLQHNAKINVVNNYGINPIHMLAMVHVDHNKYFNLVANKPWPENSSSIDNVPQLEFNEQDVEERITQIKIILSLMKQSNPDYFNKSINQPREKTNGQKGSSTPLAKVIAYARDARYLASIIQPWKHYLEPVIPGKISGDVPIARYVISNHDPEFILKFNELFPGTLSATELSKKYQSTRTALGDLLFDGNSLQSKANHIMIIKKINNNSPEIIDCITNACYNKFLEQVRDKILSVASNKHIEILKNTKNSEESEKVFLNILQCIYECKDWFRLLAIYDKHSNSTGVTNFLDSRINEIHNQINDPDSSYKSILLKQLEELKNHLTSPPQPNEDEDILKKYCSLNKITTGHGRI